MGLSVGWLMLLGGSFGTFRVLRAKTFSWANDVDINVSDEERQNEQAMTKGKRLALVVVCLVVALAGALLIQRSGTWNPLRNKPSGGDDNVVVGHLLNTTMQKIQSPPNLAHSLGELGM